VRPAARWERPESPTGIACSLVRSAKRTSPSAAPDRRRTSRLGEERESVRFRSDLNIV
jgi:hypothetical protein